MKNKEKIFVGIDVSKHKLDIYFYPVGKYFQVGNNLSGFKQLLQKLSSFEVDLVAMESTGMYHRDIFYFLSDNNFKVSILNPLRVRNFAKSLDYLAKTDKIDAKNIALFAAKLNPRISNPPSKSERRLDSLNRRRKQLIKIRASEKTRIQTESDSFVSKEISKNIKILSKQIDKIDCEIDSVLQSDETLNSKFKTLKTIPGVGDKVAKSLITDLPELGKVSNKQISSIVGVAPKNRDSGLYKGERKISGGRQNLRCDLYMSVLSIIKGNSSLKIFYQNLVKRGKKPQIAIVATIRKIVSIANSLIKNNQVFLAKTSNI
jgi:transposase